MKAQVCQENPQSGKTRQLKYHESNATIQYSGSTRESGMDNFWTSWNDLIYSYSVCRRNDKQKNIKMSFRFPL